MSAQTSSKHLGGFSELQRGATMMPPTISAISTRSVEALLWIPGRRGVGMPVLDYSGRKPVQVTRPFESE